MTLDEINKSIVNNQINTKNSVQVHKVYDKWMVFLVLPTDINQKEFDNKSDADRFAYNFESHLSTMIYHTTKAMFGM